MNKTSENQLWLGLFLLINTGRIIVSETPLPMKNRENLWIRIFRKFLKDFYNNFKCEQSKW